jgi:hypothetical protein
MAADLSARGQRQAILSSTLSELDSFKLTVDCGTSGCLGERSYRIAELGGLPRRWRTLGSLLRRLRCRRCGRPMSHAWLASGERFDTRFIGQRFTLLEPDAEKHGATDPQ